LNAASRGAIRSAPFVLALLVALILIACGDDAASEPTATPTLEPSPTATATPTPEPPADLEAGGARIFEHARVLAVDIGPRPAGTDAERQGAAYIRQVLESYGYDVSIQEFEFEARDFVPSRIETPGGDVAPYSFAGSPDGEARGRLVDAGLGRTGDFASGVNGAVALVRRGETAFQEKVDNATAAGAVAVIVSNNEPGRLLGALESSEIPVVGVDQAAGESLLEQAGADVTVFIPPRSGIAVNVFAMQPGTERCETVTGGHHDTVAVTGGASDNASGTAAVLEVARLAAVHDLPGDHCFVLFGAEELGLIGSAAYVRDLTDAELDGLRAMLNLDVVGSAETLQLIGTPELVEMAGRRAVELGVIAQPGGLPEGVGSDHLSFMREGVPVLMFSRRDPLIHTPQDVIDRIEPQSLEDAAALAFAVLREAEALHQ
jgi:aminopeptidase YwaD